MSKYLCGLVLPLNSMSINQERNAIAGLHPFVVSPINHSQFIIMVNRNVCHTTLLRLLTSHIAGGNFNV